jgi:hypothetical protein
LYLVFPQGAESPVSLPSRVASFYRWLYRFYSQTGDLHACTAYYAKKQGVSERTIYRWLARLRSLEYITTEQVAAGRHGPQRIITPHLEPPKKRKSVRQDVRQDVRVSSSKRDAGTASTTGTQDTVTQAAPEAICSIPDDTEQREVVSAIADVGVIPRVAVHLVAKHGVEPVRVQLEALKHRNVRDRAAALVASIRNNWPLPAAMVKQQQEARKLALRASERAFRVALDRKREEDRQQAVNRFYGLPGHQQAAILEQARQSLQRDMPGAYQVMQGRAGFDAVVLSRALELLAEGGRIDGS